MTVRPPSATTRRLRGGLLNLGVALSACAPNRAGWGNANGCRPADPDQTPQRLDYFRELVSSPNGDDQRVRMATGLAAGSASAVELVTDRATCVKAIAAVNARRNELRAVREVWVVTLAGGDYAVEDPALVTEGEYVPVYLFDRDFQFKTILYPW